MVTLVIFYSLLCNCLFKKQYLKSNVLFIVGTVNPTENLILFMLAAFMSNGNTCGGVDLDFQSLQMNLVNKYQFHVSMLGQRAGFPTLVPLCLYDSVITSVYCDMVGILCNPRACIQKTATCLWDFAGICPLLHIGCCTGRSLISHEWLSESVGAALVEQELKESW